MTSSTTRSTPTWRECPAATTTGASVVTDYGDLSKSLSMWRQFTQWLGGMGIIILAVAVLPRLRVGGRQMMESELPGPEVSRLPDRIRQTARLLWVLYIGLTALLALLLASLGWLGIDDAMTPYQALAHAFTTMPTGGFSTQVNSIAAFSAGTQWIIALFMFIAGANFVLLYRGVVKARPRLFARDEELRLYVVISVGAAIALTIQLWAYGIEEGEAAVRAGVFQAVSDHHDHRLRDHRLRDVAGALPPDALRAHVRGRLGGLDDRLDQDRPPPARRQGAPARARPDREPGGRHAGAPQRRPVDERTLRAIGAFLLLYIGIWAVGASVIAIDSAISNVPLNALDTIAVSASALGNGGPGFGITGPFGSFAPLGDVSKVTMIVLMWLGRLEIDPGRRAAHPALLAGLARALLRAEERLAQVERRVLRHDRQHLVARPEDRARLDELRPPVRKTEMSRDPSGNGAPDARARRPASLRRSGPRRRRGPPPAARAAARARARAPRARRGRGCSSSRRSSA